jgi:hypothetical protein
MVAVDRAGQDLGAGRLSRAPRADEQIGWLSRPVRTWFFSVSVMCGCPATSSKVRGLYFRYNA